MKKRYKMGLKGYWLLKKIRSESLWYGIKPEPQFWTDGTWWNT